MNAFALMPSKTSSKIAKKTKKTFLFIWKEIQNLNDKICKEKFPF